MTRGKALAVLLALMGGLVALARPSVAQTIDAKKGQAAALEAKISSQGEREASHRSQDKDARRISVGQCGIIRDDRDALAKPRRLERGRIEDVMVAYAVLEEKSFVIA